MADQKPTVNFYDNLGGINQKASAYAVGRAQFLDLRNVDFDVPNALSKRPGSTQAVSSGTSGPVTSLFEFVKLTGESYVIAGTDTAMFYLAVNAYTLLDGTWNNGQPTDMLTFVNKLWMANGQKYKWWTGSTLLPAGLPCPKTGITTLTIHAGGGTAWQVAGVTAGVQNNLAPLIYASYGYVRADGFYGPTDFHSKAVLLGQANSGDGISENLYGASIPIAVGGFTTPTGFGITAIALYVGLFTNTPTPFQGATFEPGGGFFQFLKPEIETAGKFYLYTLLSTGATVATLVIPSWTDFQSTATPFENFSAMNFCWFETNTPKYLEQNQNVMWMAGFSQQPSVLWFSEVGSPEFFEADYNFEVRTNDGDRITATKAYNNQLIVFKQNSFHKVVGDSPDNFQLVELSQQFGCLSNKTVVEFKEDLVWLDQRGVVRFNGASWDVISVPVEDTFRRMNLTAALEKACAVHYKFRNQIWFGIPIDNSTKNNLTIVWDYLVDAWTIFDGFDVASAALIKAYNNRPTVWRGDYSGMIYYHGEVFYGDNGRGITCSITPHWDKGKENETWIQRRFFLDVNTVAGLTGTLTGRVFKDYDATTVQATFTMYQNSFQSRAEMGVVGKAFSVELTHYSESLPLLINGYSWAKRFLRNV